MLGIGDVTRAAKTRPGQGPLSHQIKMRHGLGSEDAGLGDTDVDFTHEGYVWFWDLASPHRGFRGASTSPLLSCHGSKSAVN